MYKVEINKKVTKFLRKHPIWLSRKFENALKLLQENPIRKELDIKKLKRFKNDYRLRIGKYRFLYSVIEPDLLIYVYKADIRGDVYKNKKN